MNVLPITASFRTANAESMSGGQRGDWRVHFFSKPQSNVISIDYIILCSWRPPTLIRGNEGTVTACREKAASMPSLKALLI